MEKETKEFLKSITQEAGNKLKKYFQEDKENTSIRGTSKEVVLKYDKIIDEFLIGKIKEKYPAHNLLTEESEYLKGNSDYLWIIDSLDGTGNFANRNPLFSVCIALAQKGTLIMGAVFCPMIEEFYYAEKGKGAFLNNRKIEVSDINQLDSSYIFYCEGGEKDKNKLNRILSNVYPEVKDLRKIGSAGIETAWVAAGRGDGYFTTQIDPWDVGAGTLLVEEAGGKVTDFNNNDWKPEKNSLVFSNGKIHQSLLNTIKKS